MESIVAAWREKVPGDTANYKVLAAGLVVRDQEVRTWIETHLKGAIVAGIDSCVSRCSDSLALPVPSSYVAVHVFATYLQQLTTTGLTVDVAVNAQGPETSLLLLNPGSASEHGG